MSMVGWYPDPGGAPGRYRYWDGATWSDETVGDPREPAPTPSGLAAPRAGTGSGRKWRIGQLVGVLTLVVVLLAVGLIVVQRVRAVSDTPIDPYPSGGTSTGWDDASPSPTPPATSTPTPGPKPSLVPCAVGNPNQRAPHPDDQRVHGGSLSFAEVKTFKTASNEERFSFAHDVTQQTLAVNDQPKWIAQLAVGRLLGTDGFTGSARASAETVAECLITTDMYQPYDPTRNDLRSKAVRVGGKRAWLIETRVTVQVEELPFPGDRVVIIVVPDGDDWSFFFGAVPIGNNELGNVLDDTVADLRAD